MWCVAAPLGTQLPQEGLVQPEALVAVVKQCQIFVTRTGLPQKAPVSLNGPGRTGFWR